MGQSFRFGESMYIYVKFENTLYSRCKYVLSSIVNSLE